MRADQLRREQQAGPALDLLALQRVDAVAGPHPVGALAASPGRRARRRRSRTRSPRRDAARAARRAAGRRPASAPCTPGAPSWPASTRSRLWSHLRYADRVLGQQRVEPLEDVRVGLGDGQVEHLLVARAPAAAATARGSIQSGCARARSESGLTISGSTHSPNCMPEPGARGRPAGAARRATRRRTTYQSPSARRVVATVPEPAVVEHEPLRTDRGRGVRERGQPAEVVVEVDRLPGVERDRPRRRAGAAAARASRRGTGRRARPARRPTTRRPTGWCRTRPRPAAPRPSRAARRRRAARGW